MDKLKLGIEIISAMKASAYSTTIEEGRILALEETEIDRMEGVTPEYFGGLKQEDKDRFISIAKHEKERLHKQALFVASIVLDYLGEVGETSKRDNKECALPVVNGWHLFAEVKPKHGDNIEVYYKDGDIVNVDWQDYLLKDKAFGYMMFWRACR